MRTTRSLWAAALLLSASSLCAHAQVAEFGVAGGTSRLNGRTLTPAYSLDDGWNLNFRLTLNNARFFGHEFGYSYNRTKLLLLDRDQGGMAVHMGFYNFLLYGLPEGRRVRPFVTGGAHYANFVPPGASATQGQGSNKFGVNYGAGVKVRIRETWMFRVDYRQFLQGKPFSDVLPVSGSLKINQISAGISFTL